ncbi:sulfite exporter TauE/SafE family protein [uncultured Methanomethylovorans sp.]|uniref:sulfite exporter TauE/SafE family protein n=1 Tax=uncultured Methanomethylovorans sp. TaxID=183759 RepID=UPI00261D9B02|nr:sulfite exporter TauE/SafE family protein [uncultured Methanomethylovorans sp.]
MIELFAGLVTLAATSVLTIAGVGAAFILIPIYMSMGIELHTAMSTALLLNCIAMIFASMNFAREHLILWRTAFPILISATVLSLLGSYSSQYFPRNTLLLLFVIFLFFAASMMLFYKPKQKEKQNSVGKDIVISTGVGSIAGFVGGLLGVGGGNIIVPALVWLGIEPKKASATTAFIVIFSSFSGFLGRASLGHLDVHLLLFTAVGAILGAILGSWLLSKKLNNRQIKIAIGLILYFIAFKMAYDLLF